MRVKLFIAGDDFLEAGMWESPLHPHNDGLGHLVRDHFTQALFALATFFLFRIGCISHTNSVMPLSCVIARSGFRHGRCLSVRCANEPVFLTDYWPVASAN